MKAGRDQACAYGGEIRVAVGVEPDDLAVEHGRLARSPSHLMP